MEADPKPRSLQGLRVARPCPASWDDMAGGERVRYCGLCKRNVYNFAELGEAEALELLATSGGDVCGLLYRRADGTVLTADCPVGRQRFRVRLLQRTFAAAASLALLLGGRFLTPAFRSRCETARTVAGPRPNGPSPSQGALTAKERAALVAQLGSLGYISANDSPPAPPPHAPGR